MPSSIRSTNFVRFGVFEADLNSGELRKNGAPVKIQDLPFRALKLLVGNPNEVFSREQLRQALWPDGVFVDFDRGITSAINRLRDALGDSAENPVFVETVGRRGYRWIAPTHTVAPLAPPDPVISSATTDAVPSSASRQWKWIFVAPLLILLLAVWVYRLGDLSAHSRMKSRTTTLSASPHTPNPEAKEFYLKGRFYWNKRTPESLNKAVDAFTQAIVRDPNYADAYVGLADCYNLMREYTLMPATEAYPRALAAARKAVELDDRSSQARAALAFVSFFGMWDAPTAAREFRRALELDPNNANAHHWFGTYLLSMRRFTESLSEMERAQALDPSSKSILADKGLLLICAGRQAEGVALLKQMEENEPDFLSPHRDLKGYYLETGNYANFLVEARKEAILLHDQSALSVADAAARSFNEGGAPAMLETMRQEQKKLYARGQISPYALAQTCSLAGHKQEALQYLKAAYDQHAEGIPGMENDAFLKQLHNEPMFRELVAKAGLPPLG
jgi:DNA-binding winged helix-turn-helix (wHTH) protein/Tfp pilus assembly protein PilF